MLWLHLDSGADCCPALRAVYFVAVRGCQQYGSSHLAVQLQMTRLLRTAGAGACTKPLLAAPSATLLCRCRIPSPKKLLGLGGCAGAPVVAL